MGIESDNVSDFVNTCSVVQTAVTYEKHANVLCNAVI